MSDSIVVHYGLINELHQMDAKIFNSNEANIISIIENIANFFDFSIDIDVAIREEGGIKDVLKLKPKTTFDRWCIALGGIIGTALIENIISNTLNKFLTNGNTVTSECLKEQSEIAKKQLEIAEKQLEVSEKSNTLKEVEINKIDELKEKIENIHNVDVSDLEKKRSHIYKNMNKNEKIEYFSIENKDEILGKVEHKDFSNFILPENREEDYIDENATILIVSPVLNDSKNYWRGIYRHKEENIEISFSMGDREFKDMIIRDNIQFSAGANNILSARLKCKKIIKEDGSEILNPKCSVDEVFFTETKTGTIDVFKEKKKKKFEDDKQYFLFNDIGENNDG